MSSDQSNSQPTNPGSGNPIALHPDSAAVRAVQAAVDELKLHRNYMERDVTKMTDEMRSVLDRMARLETKVEALPTKIWIGTAIASMAAFLTVLIGLLALADKLLK